MAYTVGAPDRNNPLNAKVLAEVALKVWGVYLVLGAILSVPAALVMFGASAPDPAQAAFVRSTNTSYLVDLVVQAVGGLAVLVWADRIVALFEADISPVELPLSATQLQMLAFGIAGVFVLVEGLRDAAAAGHGLYTRAESSDAAWYLAERPGETMATAIVQTVAGAILLFGREGIATGWARLRQRTSSEIRGEDDEEQDGDHAARS